MYLTEFILKFSLEYFAISRENEDGISFIIVHSMPITYLQNLSDILKNVDIFSFLIVVIDLQGNIPK